MTKNFLSSFTKIIQAVVRAVPIVGRLPFVSRRAHWEAIKESFLAILFSGLPVLLPLVVAVIIPSLPIGDFLNKLTGEGELFLYASAFVGPLIYAVLKTRIVRGADEDTHHLEHGYIFPYGLSFVLMSFGICIVSVVAFALIRLAPLGEQSAHHQGYPIQISSLVVYIMSVLCLYSASVYRNELEDTERVSEVMRNDEQTFVEKWRQR